MVIHKDGVDTQPGVFVTPTTEAVTELAGIVAQTTEFLNEEVEF